jgi:hypothetical protein
VPAFVPSRSLKSGSSTSHTQLLAESVIESLAGQGHGYSEKTGRAVAADLVGVAEALTARPLGPPPQ